LRRDLAGAAMQIDEYKHDLENIEKIAGAKFSSSESELCHYVKRQYNDGGIWTKADPEPNKKDIIGIINRNITAADSEILLPDRRSKLFMRTIKYIMSVKEDVDEYGNAQPTLDMIFERYVPQIKSHVSPSRVSPSRDSKRRRANIPSSGGKMSSTRKRVALIHRIRSRKNKRCIRYTKNKK